MQHDLRQRRLAICGSDFLLLCFQSSRHSLISDAIFSFWIIWLHHFRQRYHGDLRFESLLVNRINIAPVRAAKLRSYWKRVFFIISSPILLLSSAQLCAARKSLLENQL
jgi:hypothetical protein